VLRSNRRENRALRNGRVARTTFGERYEPIEPWARPTHQEAAEYIASLLEGLKLVCHSARMPFLAYSINVALEEANNEKTYE
jgi:hypothetical protein